MSQRSDQNGARINGTESSSTAANVNNVDTDVVEHVTVNDSDKSIVGNDVNNNGSDAPTSASSSNSIQKIVQDVLRTK